MIEKINSFKIYVAKISDYCNNDILPSYTKLEIKRLTNEKIIQQKRATYGLLRQIIFDNYGIDEDFQDFYKKDGKPFCKKFCFSISHSHHLVAIAISDNDVGIDIEKIDFTKNYIKIAKFIATEKELKLCKDIQSVTKLWTQKEAIFKLGSNKLFIHKDIETSNHATKSYQINCNSDKYCLTIAYNKKAKIELFNYVN